MAQRPTNKIKGQAEIEDLIPESETYASTLAALEELDRISGGKSLFFARQRNELQEKISPQSKEKIPAKKEVKSQPQEEEKPDPQDEKPKVEQETKEPKAQVGDEKPVESPTVTTDSSASDILISVVEKSEEVVIAQEGDQEIIQEEKIALAALAEQFYEAVQKAAEKNKIEVQEVVDSLSLQADGVIQSSNKALGSFFSDISFPDFSVDTSGMGQKMTSIFSDWKQSITAQGEKVAVGIEEVSNSITDIFTPLVMENSSNDSSAIDSLVSLQEPSSQESNEFYEPETVFDAGEEGKTLDSRKGPNVTIVPLEIPVQEKNEYKEPESEEAQQEEAEKPEEKDSWTLLDYLIPLRWGMSKEKKMPATSIIESMDWSDENFSSQMHKSWERAFSTLGDKYIVFMKDDGTWTSVVPIPLRYRDDAWYNLPEDTRTSRWQEFLDESREKLKEKGEVNDIKQGEYPILMQTRNMVSGESEEDTYVGVIGKYMNQEVKNSTLTKYQYARQQLNTSNILPPSLKKILLGVPAQESNYKDNTTSHIKNAQGHAFGAWQILLPTAKEIDENATREQLKDFSYATNIAIKYFEKQYQSIKRNDAVGELVRIYKLKDEDIITPLVLSSYHAGYANVVSAKTVEKTKTNKGKKILGMATWAYQKQKDDTVFAAKLKQIPPENFYEFIALSYARSGYNPSYGMKSFWYPIKVQALAKAIDPLEEKRVFSKPKVETTSVLPEEKRGWWGRTFGWGDDEVVPEKSSNNGWFSHLSPKYLFPFTWFLSDEKLEESSEAQRISAGEKTPEIKLKKYSAHSLETGNDLNAFIEGRDFFKKITFSAQYKGAVNEEKAQEDGFWRNFGKSGLLARYKKMRDSGEIEKVTPGNIETIAPRKVALQNDNWRLRGILGGKNGSGNNEKYCRTSEKGYKALVDITNTFQEKLKTAGIDTDTWGVRPIVTSLTRVFRPPNGSDVSPHDYATGMDFSRTNFDLYNKKTGQYVMLSASSGSDIQDSIFNVSKTLFVQTLQEFDTVTLQNTRDKKGDSIMTIENNPPHYHVALLPDAVNLSKKEATILQKSLQSVFPGIAIDGNVGPDTKEKYKIVTGEDFDLTTFTVEKFNTALEKYKALKNNSSQPWFGLFKD